MIKAIIFDCFGVLTTDRWVEFCAGLPKGPVVDEARRLNHIYDAGKMGLDEFLDKVTKVTGADKNFIKDIFVNPPSSKNMDLFDYISSLKNSYKIGILSNVASNWVRESFLTPSEQTMFTAMAFSYEIGATKPDPATYNTILAKLGVSAGEAVFIDDQPRFCEGASQLGMKGIVYKDFHQMKTELEAILAE